MYRIMSTDAADILRKEMKMLHIYTSESSKKNHFNRSISHQSSSNQFSPPALSPVGRLCRWASPGCRRSRGASDAGSRGGPLPRRPEYSYEIFDSTINAWSTDVKSKPWDIPNTSWNTATRPVVLIWNFEARFSTTPGHLIQKTLHKFPWHIQTSITGIIPGMYQHWCL